MWADVRIALRNLLGAPGYTAAAICTLALTIGATTAMFSAVHAVLLKPSAIRQPGSLVVCWARDDARHLNLVELSYRNFTDWAASARSFEGMAAMGSSTWPAAVDIGGEAVRMASAGVSATFFNTLGVAPLLGRALAAADDRPTAPRVVVLSHRAWAARFGSDRAVIGTALRVDDAAHTVVGVMPEDFDFPRGTDFWMPVVPILARGSQAGRPSALDTVGVLFVIGRLQAGVTPAAARHELDMLAARLEREGGAPRFGSAVVVTPFLEYALGPVRQALWILFAAVGVLLLIGCANVSGLLLTRVSSRRRDHAIRLALGASPAAVARLWLVETAILATAGGAIGLVTAHVMAQALIALAPVDLPRLGSVRIDTTAAAFACAIVAMTAVLCGAGPIRHAVAPNLRESLNDTARATATRSTQRARSALVALEIALAIALMIAAGLVTRSFVNLRQLDLGFTPDGVLALNVSPRAARTPNDWIAGFLARVSAMPGVEAAGAVYLRPLALGPIGQEALVTLEGQSESADAARQNPALNYQVATPGYFRTMRIALKRGRLFTSDDGGRSARVALVGESAARRLWPGQDAVGRRILLPSFSQTGSARVWRTIVGVVGDVHYRGAGDVRLDVYDPAAQATLVADDVAVRSSGDPIRVAAAVQAAAREMDPRVLVSNIATLEAIVARAIAPWRFSVWVFMVFALVALVLATGGLFSLVTIDVARRRREFAVRAALGAPRSDIFRSVLLSAVPRLAGGVAFGVLAAAASSGVVRSILFGVEPLDAATYVSVVLLVVVVVVVASCLPARRAAAEDPLPLLRGE
jgi:putative ABC transport system permease protein